MRASNKTLLIAKVMDDKTPRQHIVGAFTDDKTAKAFGAAINQADKAKDATTVLALDPSAHKDKAGAVIHDIKFALLQVPYNPEPYAVSDELFGETSSAK